jgi:hypothetical protein
MPSNISTSDPYFWVGSSTGSWNDPANWQDQTTGAAGVPTAKNAVTFGVDTPAQQTFASVTVTGTGRSASLALYEDLTLSGTFRTGALNLFIFYKPQGNSYLDSQLTVAGAGNSLQATAAHAEGNLVVNDGGTMTVAHTYEIASGKVNPNSPDFNNYGVRVDGSGSRLTIGGLLSTDNSSDVVVTNGGYLEAGRMTLDNSYGVGAYAVDTQSTIEVGTLGNAAAGTWTIDAGRILTVENRVQLSAPEYVVNGVIDDVGGLDLTGSPGNVVGSGRIRLEAGALLTVGQAGCQLSVVFKADNAVLDLADGADAFAATIRQFVSGDSIAVDGGTSFDSATWQRGVLSLFSGTTLVGTLRMAGKYKGDTFSVTNDVITLDPASTASAAAVRQSATPKSLQLFTQAIASFEQHGSALHEPSAAAAQHADHAWLAASAR